MRLWALSDLHVNHKRNREALEHMPVFGDDWLILGGDIAERTVLTEWTLDLMLARFARVFWVPGNHELWTLDGDTDMGVERYERLVETCRLRGVHTPEDEFVLWNHDGCQRIIALCFVLYDYSFRPPEIPVERAVEWAVKSGVLCADEQYITPAPYKSKVYWCRDRVEYTEQRLADAVAQYPQAKIVLVNHFPLLEAHAQLWRIPRFSIWCGTKLTADWHTRFPVETAVYGHLHIRDTKYVNGVRFEEVSLGYPKHWNQGRGVEHYLRQILPSPAPKRTGLFS